MVSFDLQATCGCVSLDTKNPPEVSPEVRVHASNHLANKKSGWKLLQLR